jgi:hypothetical protein
MPTDPANITNNYETITDDSTKYRRPEITHHRALTKFCR